DRLSADSTSLHDITVALSERRESLSGVTVINMGTSFGYSDDDIGRADEGDPGALRRVALSMMERNAHPEALMGILPWYVCLLRWGGTGTGSSCGNVLTSLRIDVKAGRLDGHTAGAFRDFVGEVQFSSPLDPTVVERAFDVTRARSVEFASLQLMWLK